jgi:hypothetical protein
MILITLGGDKEIETWQWTSLSNDIWHFDTEWGAIKSVTF